MKTTIRPRRTRFAGAVVLACATVFATAAAAQDCGLCNTEIVINAPLAGCFLEKYQDLSQKTDGAVVVDLSGCPADRGIVEALPTPDGSSDEPDLTFMVTRTQLRCLKAKLEQPGLALDPSARIDLASCG